MRRWPFLADYQARLSREGNPRPVEREAEASEHHEVGVQSNTGQSANAERREAVVVLEPTEFALDGRTASVEVAEPLRVSLDTRIEAGRGFDDRHDDLLRAPLSGTTGWTPRSSHSAWQRLES